MKKINFLSFILSVLISTQIQAFEYNQMIYSTTTGEFTSFDNMVEDLSNYDVIYLGEQHDQLSHHQSQKNIMRKVRDIVGPVSVGFEFLKWTKQEYLNDYFHGLLDEEEFLRLVEWGDSNYPFSFYSPMIDVARSSGGHAFGLNAPQWLTKKITRQGIDSLTESEVAFLPPRFQLGSDLYFQRFKEIMDGMQHPIPPQMIGNLFQSQSVWDETMSFHVALNMKHSYGPFFIIVGNFHVAYKLGSPTVLQRRLGPDKSIVTVYHANINGLNEDDIRELTFEHEEYGYIADYVVFTYQF